MSGRKRIRPLSPRGLKTYSLKERKSKVAVADFATPYRAGSSMKEFLQGLPKILAGRDLHSVAEAVVKAVKGGRMVALGMGAHVIKAGLSPIIIDLIERGVVKAVAMNGAGIVHDFETAYAGATSEDVDTELLTGNFGTARETGTILNRAIRKNPEKGIGAAVGEMIERSKYPYKEKSILAACQRMSIPATVHVALGTDILHIHPQMDGAATGRATMTDFRTFSSVVASLEGGVYINMGSAVILPEVFLKALTLARNLGYRVKEITTVNMDFLRHYRPLTNVVRRPTAGGGQGFSLTGHHEIMVPLLSAAIIEALEG